MNRLDIIKRVRSITRDFSNAIFRESDIIDYINEGVDRVRQVIPELIKMDYLLENANVPEMLPSQYHHLLSVYAASRCFSQDERHYQATNLMNEFEQKLDEMKTAIESGLITIIDPVTGLPVDTDGTVGIDFVKTSDYYFNNRRSFSSDYE